jgi:hypothetical protein
MQVETTMKLQVALDYSIPGLHRNEDVTAGLFSARNANVRILALMPSEAEGLADRLAGCGETEAAEAAYIRILNAYREFRKNWPTCFGAQGSTSVLRILYGRLSVCAMFQDRPCHPIWTYWKV